MQAETVSSTNVTTALHFPGDVFGMSDAIDTTHLWKARVAENLRDARRKAGFTQQVLADLAGVNYATLRSIEAQHSTPGFDKLVLLSAALQISPADLFGPEIAPPPQRRLIRRDGVVEPGDDTFRFFELEADIPEFGLRAGDTLVVDTGLGVEPGRMIIIDEGGDIRLHKVESMNPTILSRPQAPSVVFDKRYHRIVGRIARLQRDDP